MRPPRLTPTLDSPMAKKIIETYNLNYWCPMREIAEMCGSTWGSVKVVLHYARKQGLVEPHNRNNKFPPWLPPAFRAEWRAIQAKGFAYQQAKEEIQQHIWRYTGKAVGGFDVIRFTKYTKTIRS